MVRSHRVFGRLLRLTHVEHRALLVRALPPLVVLAAAALGGFVAYAMRVNKRRLRDVVAGRWRAVEEEGWKAEAVEGMMPGARFERYYG